MNISDDDQAKHAKQKNSKRLAFADEETHLGEGDAECDVIFEKRDGLDEEPSKRKKQRKNYVELQDVNVDKEDMITKHAIVERQKKKDKKQTEVLMVDNVVLTEAHAIPSTSEVQEDRDRRERRKKKKGKGKEVRVGEDDVQVRGDAMEVTKMPVEKETDEQSKKKLKEKGKQVPMVEICFQREDEVVTQAERERNKHSKKKKKAREMQVQAIEEGGP